VNWDGVSVDDAALRLLPIETCIKYTVVPIRRVERTLFLAMADTNNLFAVDDIRFMTGCQVVPVQASTSDIQAVIARVADTSVEPYAQHEPSEPDTSTAPGAEHGVVALVDELLSAAVERRTTDIHVEPTATDVIVRFRIDAALTEHARFPLRLRDTIVSRLKIMAMLDVAEKRLPQDGRFNMRFAETRKIDFRMATLPTIYGERIILRLVETLPARSIDDLGFAPDVLSQLAGLLKLPRGLITVAAPFRSGLTTTLHAIVERLSIGDRCILTAEDPVEGMLNVASRVQLQAAIGLNYAAALRSFQRHDPDVVMITDVPDAETAQVALDFAAAVAIVAGLRAPDAATALAHLLRFGVAPHRLLRGFRCVLAQHLVRRLCERCKASCTPVAEDLDTLEASGVPVPAGTEFWQPNGCTACDGRGYQGRFAVGELLMPREHVTAALGRPMPGELRQAAVADGMVPLTPQVLEAARCGHTSLEECLRVIGDIHRP
jgi:type IV pilus assembly protein PilB